MEKIPFKEIFVETLREIRKKKWAIVLLILTFVLIPCWIISAILSGVQVLGYELLGLIPLYKIVAIIIAFFLWAIVDVYIVYMFRPDEEMRGISFFKVLKRGNKFLLKRVGMNLLFIIVFMPLTFFFVFPAIYLGIYWLFTKYIVIIEQQGLVDSIKESKALMKKKWKFIFKYVFMALVVLSIVELAIILLYNHLSSIAIYYSYVPPLITIIGILNQFYIMFILVFMSAYNKRLYISAKIHGKEDEGYY